MKIYFVFLLYIISTAATAQSNSSLQKKTKPQLYYQKVVEYLASDELEGRLTGMPGEKKSAEFIREEMKSAGLTSPEGLNYLQTFKYTYLRLPTSTTKMMLDMVDSGALYTFGKDFLVMSKSCDTCNTFGSVFDAGYGLNLSENNSYGKYTQKDSGKVFIIKMGHPNKENPHSKLGLQATVSNKVKWALEKGASGIIFHNPDGFDNEPTGKLKKNAKPSGVPVFFAKTPITNISKIMRIGMNSNVAKIQKTGHNVIGMVKRNERKKYLVIGAHHDHIGKAEMGNSRAQGQEIHNGADDNASGVAMMLHMAKRLKNHPRFRKYNLIFVAFSGEELGLLGSKYFVNNCPIELSRILAMMNFDMVGRLNTQTHTAVINGIGTSPYWGKRIKRIKTDTSKLKLNTTISGIGASDHSSFYLKDIPAVHLFSGQHRDYHMPEDDVEKINYIGMEKLEDYTVKLLCKIPRKRLKFTPTKNVSKSSMGFKVTLGVMPDYTFSGDGMRLDNVSEGKPASIAGLRRNDVIVKMGTHVVGNVEEYMHALSHYNKGDETIVTISRNGQTIEKKVKF